MISKDPSTESWGLYPSEEIDKTNSGASENDFKTLLAMVNEADSQIQIDKQAAIQMFE